MPRLFQGVHRLIDLGGDIQGEHVYAGHHDLSNECVPEPEDGYDHLLLFLLQETFRLSCLNQADQFCLGNTAFLV